MIRQDSSWNDKPTPTQVRAIVKLCLIRGIREPLEEIVNSRAEARSLIYRLRRQYD